MTPLSVAYATILAQLMPWSGCHPHNHLQDAGIHKATSSTRSKAAGAGGLVSYLDNAREDSAMGERFARPPLTRLSSALGAAVGSDSR